VLIVSCFDSGEMYASFLRHHRFEVMLFDEPSGAVVAVTTFQPEVIVTDLMFAGGLDALEFTRRVRESIRGAVIPVIVVSGYVRESDRQMAREAGADRFLIKPCLPETLMGEIDTAISAYRRGRRVKWNWPAIVPERRAVERRQGQRRKP
jgi:DNA-binding response OmpR family regulator